jgi:hypothetical protein
MRAALSDGLVENKFDPARFADALNAAKHAMLQQIDPAK